MRADVAIGTDRRTEAARILERCVVLTLTVHFLGNTRKVSTDAVVKAASGTETLAEDARKVDTTQVSSTKRLVDNAVLNPAMRVITRTKNYLRRQAFSAHRVFGERSYLVPLLKVEAVDAQLEEFANDLRTEARRVKEQYAAAQERQRLALGDLYDASQYPDPESIETAFELDWRYVSFQSPDRLETVSTALAEASNRKHLAQLSDMHREARLSLRQMMQETVAALIEKLKPGVDGEPKAIRGTLLKDVSEFVTEFGANDVTDDGDLQKLVRRMRAIHDGVNLDDLRGDDGDQAREQLRAQLATALKDVDSLVVSAKRGISLRDLSEVA